MQQTDQIFIMKHIVTSFFLTFLVLHAVCAQTIVDAKEIIDKINRQEAVSYQNATITGDLDLTNLANRKRASTFENWGSENYLSVVTVPLSFRNCTFRGKVLAYRNEEGDGKLLKTHNVVYNTDFTRAVTVEDCRFENDAAFKYSVFTQDAIFTNSYFRNGALFKYSNFQADADFGGSTFHEYADFKYTKFNDASIFQKASFERYADFKYTKFSEGVDFRQTHFVGNADFKYTNLPRGTSFNEARFEGSTDFKYTKLDGRKFSPSQY